MIEAYGASNVGCVRTNNEDYFLVAPTIGLYVVADGMAARRRRTRLQARRRNCLRTFREARPVAPQCETVSDALVAAFEESNHRVMDAAASDPSLEGMGTTLIAAMECEDGLIVASVGDSRGYQIEQRRLTLITEDQTWVNEVGRAWASKRKVSRPIPCATCLPWPSASSEQLRVHTYELHPEPGTHILLCSDGLHGVAPEEEMAVILQTKRFARIQVRTTHRRRPRPWRPG